MLNKLLIAFAACISEIYKPRITRLARGIFHTVFDASFPEPYIIAVDGDTLTLLGYEDCNAVTRLPDNRDDPCTIYVYGEVDLDVCLKELLTHELIHAELWHTHGVSDHGFEFVKRTQEIHLQSGIWVQCPASTGAMTDTYSEV